MTGGISISGIERMKHFREKNHKTCSAIEAEGKTNREISKYYEFKNKFVIKQLIARYNRKQRMLKAGIVPRRKGRPPKGYIVTSDEKGNKIKRLKMENALLRSFLQIVGRK